MKGRVGVQLKYPRVTPDNHYLQVVELMGMLVGEVEEINQGIALANVLRQRSLALREGLVAEGRIPPEPWVVDGVVQGYFGLEKEWAEEETSAEEESGAEDDGEEEEEDEEEEEEEEDIVIEEPEQEEPEWVGEE